MTRKFWISSREDVRKLRRITLLWDYLRAATDANRAFPMGEPADMQYVPA